MGHPLVAGEYYCRSLGVLPEVCFFEQDANGASAAPPLRQVDADRFR